MTRQERIMVAATAFIVGAFVGSLVTGAARWLNRQQAFTDGANVIQWAGGLATFAGLGMVVWWYWSRRCATPRCIRLGEHPVKGTRVKVCHRHHDVHHHELAHAIHWLEDALTWGESHGQTEPILPVSPK